MSEKDKENVPQPRSFITRRVELADQPVTDEVIVYNRIVIVTIQLERYLVIPGTPSYEADASGIREDGEPNELARERVRLLMGDVAISDKVWNQALKLADKGAKAFLIKSDEITDDGKTVVVNQP